MIPNSTFCLLISLHSVLSSPLIALFLFPVSSNPTAFLVLFYNSSILIKSLRTSRLVSSLFLSVSTPPPFPFPLTSFAFSPNPAQSSLFHPVPPSCLFGFLLHFRTQTHQEPLGRTPPPGRLRSARFVYYDCQIF